MCLWVSEATGDSENFSSLQHTPVTEQVLPAFFLSTNSLHQIIVFPNLHFKLIWAKLALELLHEMHVIFVQLSTCCFLGVIHPFLICIVHTSISVCYYTSIIKLLIHNPLKTEHLVPTFSFPCLWILSSSVLLYLRWTDFMKIPFFHPIESHFSIEKL